MNEQKEKLKELARQAKPSPNLIWSGAELERFAELVRQDYLRELKALKPVAWVTTEQFASTAHNVTRVTLHQEVNGIPLYALDEVTK